MALALAMVEEKPLLTMVKLRTIDNVSHSLSDESRALLDTLTMLCSFKTAEDLASFLFSPMFALLIGEGGPWVVFEIGIYLDHTKTIELIPSKKEMLLADVQASGVFEGHVQTIQTEGEAVRMLAKWHTAVFVPENRFE
jgi:hypothetical protein